MKRSRDVSARRNWNHFHVLVTRYLRQITTSWSTLLSLLLQAPVMLVIVSLVYETNAFASPDGILAGDTTVFVLVLVSSLMGILNSYREICKEREILAREVFGGLDVTSYALSKFAVLAGVGLVQSAILFFGSLTFIDYHMQSAVVDVLYSFSAIFLTNLASVSIGLFVSAVLKKSESAILPVLLIIIMQVVFADVLLPLEGVASYFVYVTPTMWGASVLGNRFAVYSYQDSFKRNPLLSLLALAVFVLVFFLLTVLRLKRDYRKRS